MNRPDPIRLDSTYVLLTDHDAEHLDGGDAFWARLEHDPELVALASSGWLVGEYPNDRTWDYWEVHPDGAELVHVAAGEIDLHLGTADDTRRLVAGETIVIPRDTWHTVTVHRPGRLLNITWGRDTRTRPRT